jgi:hypothetical protein
LLIALVLASGCADVSFGSQKIGDFGNTKDEQKAVTFFKAKYGDPLTNSGPPRFLEPMVTTGLVNNTPVNKVTKFSKDTGSIFFWVFYDNFKNGDPLTLTWTFNGKTIISIDRKAGGDFGRAFGEFIKPDKGWVTGTHTITITGGGTLATATFEIIDGATQTVPLPYEQAGGAVPAIAPKATDEQGCPSNPPPLPPWVLCNGVCTNTSGDRANCGSCGNACPQEQCCKDGVCRGWDWGCQLNCPSGQTSCNGHCSNLQTDNENCGGCGIACPSGQICMHGVCHDCGNYMTACGDTCVSIADDPNHCGSCSNRCPSGNSCCDGECCATGVCCHASCTNLQNDNRNCGACDNACPSGQYCSGGTCIVNPQYQTCASGTTLCNGVCKNLLTDYHNCGACGYTCPAMVPNAETGCQNGICQPFCISGYGNCDGNPNNGCEVNLITDSNNCMSCGKICKSECHCEGGCIPNDFKPKPPGYTCDAN